MTPSEFKSIRNWLGVSQRRLAKFLGVNYRTLQRWEDGTQDVPRMAEIIMGDMCDDGKHIKGLDQ